MESKIQELYKSLAKCYKLSNYDTKKLWKLIEKICLHPEFEKRCAEPFYHHDVKTLGEHILCDTIVSYKMATNLKRKNHNLKKLSIELTVLIAMFHDLYEYPWQNIMIKKKLPNKHGFVHPIEAAVNAITWFPEYFENKEKALIIIDGIVHHMFPLAVRAIDKNDMELNNEEKYNKLSKKYKDMIKLSTDIGKIGKYSLRKSFFIEGRIMSRADKIVAFSKDISSVHGFIALVSGKNKNIKKRYNIEKMKHNKESDNNEHNNK